jgi:hypothetical protein
MRPCAIGLYSIWDVSWRPAYREVVDEHARAWDIDPEYAPMKRLRQGDSR